MGKGPVALLLLIIGLLAASAQAAEKPFTYRVLKVIDGDTFDATDGNIRFRVRIAGIDTPEREAPFYKLATATLRERLDGKSVLVVPVGRGIDRYNRVLGQVWIEGRDVGVTMIEAGLATYYRPGCVDFPANKKDYDYDPRTYVEAEDRARAKKLYFWSDPKPVLPCQWRKAGD